jgi:formylglycine-generating enzyme required for sulfatase activity
MKKIIYILICSPLFAANAGSVEVNWGKNKSEGFFINNERLNGYSHKSFKKNTFVNEDKYNQSKYFNNSNIDSLNTRSIKNINTSDKNNIVKKDVNLNAKSLNMVKIFGGCFPQKDINLEWICVDDYSISDTEITNHMYGLFDEKHKKNDNKPVTGIGYKNMISYAEWLSKDSSIKYKIPSKKQWTYSALSGGNIPQNICGYANLSSSYCKNVDNKFLDVASLKPNDWGVYDMFGNALELVIDVDGKNYFIGGSKDSNGVDNLMKNSKDILNAGFRLVSE